MSKKIIIITLALLAVAVVVFFTIKYTFREADKSVASEDPVAAVDASELVRLFETNEDSANQLYLGKVISVTGVVDSFKEDSASLSVYLKNSDDFSGVMCVFDKSVISTASVHTGMETTIKGVCSGYLFDIILNKCALMD